MLVVNCEEYRPAVRGNARVREAEANDVSHANVDGYRYRQVSMLVVGRGDRWRPFEIDAEKFCPAAIHLEQYRVARVDRS
jgi:hypothetical protein